MVISCYVVRPTIGGSGLLGMATATVFVMSTTTATPITTTPPTIMVLRPSDVSIK